MTNQQTTMKQFRKSLVIRSFFIRDFLYFSNGNAVAEQDFVASTRVRNQM